MLGEVNFSLILIEECVPHSYQKSEISQKAAEQYLFATKSELILSTTLWIFSMVRVYYGSQSDVQD